MTLFNNVLGKVKQWVGIGGVKVVCKSVDRLSRDGGVVTGKIELTSKSDQFITELDVELVESYSTGLLHQKQTTKIEMGKVTIPGGFEIKAGESKVIEFELGYDVAKSENDRLAEEGGVLGAMGKVGRFMDGESSKYTLSASASVKGMFIPPTHELDMAMAA